MYLVLRKNSVLGSGERMAGNVQVPGDCVYSDFIGMRFGLLLRNVVLEVRVPEK